MRNFGEMKFRHAFTAFLLCVSICLHPKASLAGDKDDLPKALRSGFLARVIADVDPRDAQATLELLTREVSRNMGLNTTPRVILYPDTKNMIEAVRRGELDMVSLPTIDYLRIRDTVPLVPAFVALHKEGVGLRFVLITHKESGIRSISQLKGKTLFALSTNKHEPGHLWLNVLLRKETQENPTIFFRQVKEIAKVSQGIMGVFFRQADGALVTRAGLEAARLLNPQLDRQLLVIAESRELSDGVTCFPENTSEKSRHNISSAIMQLSNSVTGRQLFTIFQSSGTTPFKADYLQGLEELMREQSRLRGREVRKR
jgi:ABC-type phosphate/phosphonate transport system substrate-binding protein